MIDTVKNLYHQYYNLILEWYNGLDQILQYGVLILGGVLVFMIIVFFVMVKITK